jgi:hypothetical protein
LNKTTIVTLLIAAVAPVIAFAAPRVIEINGTLDDYVKVKQRGPATAKNNFATSALGAAGSSATAGSAIPGINSVPNFVRAFQYQGKTYPYIMAGSDPATTKGTKINVDLIPLTIQMGTGDAFESVDTTYHMADSPIFNNSDYATGTGQFVDAVQRAEFWNIMPAARNWHFNLNSKVGKEIILNVPDDYGVVLHFRSGQTLAVVDFNYFAYALESIVASHVDVGAMVMAGLHNVVLSDVYGVADPLANCCTFGFHTYSNETHGADGIENVQTWGFSSWVDQGFFRNTNIADIHGLSHELAEWANDPFITNVVPAWTTPSAGQYGCTNVLEVGDPIVGFSIPIAGYDGFLFHPQSEALLQWFARISPSNAIDGAYSCPDEHALTALPLNCVAAQ